MNEMPTRDRFRPAAAGRGLWARLDMSPGQLRRVLMIAGPLLVVLVTATLWWTGGRTVSTDNAYVHAPKLMVSTDVSGLVNDVRVHEGQAVKKGEVLFSIDPQQFQIAVDNAKAQLELTALNINSMKQDYQRLLTDAASQKAQVELAKATYDRAASLVKTGATTVAAYDQAHYSYNASVKQNQSLEEQAKVLLVKLGGNPNADPTTQPSYLQAKAALDEAQRQLDHTVVRAPFDGIVTQVDALQPGTYLVAATAGLTNTGAVALVGNDEMWVDANFKETDLEYVHAGDPVEVTVDTFPGRVWHGHVQSVSPASGSEFSILPAQNASGNWVKVVQRIPVRITLDAEANAPKIRSGMSVVATIDTGHKRKLRDLW